MPKKVTAYIGVGSNTGERAETIKRSINLMEALPEVEVKKVSKLIKTEPEGGPPQRKYLNGAVQIETSLDAHELLRYLHAIEEKLGRTRKIRFGPRTIDLDILLYGEMIIDDKDLEIPHPRMHKRRFVLEPLCEIAPRAWHPALEKQVCKLQEI